MEKPRGEVMVGAISGAGASQVEMVTQAQQAIIAALAAQKAAELKLATVAIGSSQNAQRQASNGQAVDIMA